MHNWEVELVGDRIDLDRLVEAIIPRASVVRDGERFLLQAETFSEMAEEPAVVDLAVSLLEPLNGIAGLLDSGSVPVSVGHVALLLDDGSRMVFARVGASVSIRMRATVRATVIRADGTVDNSFADPAMSTLLPVAIGDEDVRRALRFIAEGTWNSLYKALEVVEHRVGGERALEDRGWVPKAALKLFARTATTCARWAM